MNDWKESEGYLEKFAPEIWDDCNPYKPLWRRIMKHVKRFLTGAVILAGIITIGLVAIAVWIEFTKLQIYPYTLSGAIIFVVLFLAYKIGEIIAD